MEEVRLDTLREDLPGVPSGGGFAASAYLYDCCAAGVTMAVMFAWVRVRSVFSYL